MDGLPGRPLDPEVDGRLQGLFDQGVCAPGDIDSRVVASLASLTPADAIECLDKLENAARTSDIRNLSAYLAGVVKRVSQAGGSSGRQTMLAPPAQHVLDQLQASGQVRRGELDGKVLRSLAEEPADVQALVMSTFAERNLHNIRNMAAFFTSHVSKVQQDLREGRVRLPPANMPPPGVGGGQRLYRGSAGPDMHQQPPAPLGMQPATMMPPQGQEAATLMGQQQHQFGNAPPMGYHAPPQQQTLPYQQQPPSHHVPPQRAPQQRFAPQQQANGYGGVAPPAGPGGLQPAGLPPLLAAPAVPAAAARGPAPKHYAVEQTEWGVRVDEFHALSPFAKYVHPAAALKLQELWDSGNKLVSLLDDESWEALANLDAQHSLGLVNQVAEAMRSGAPDDLATVNRLLMQSAGRHPRRPHGPTPASVGIAPAAAVTPAASTVPLPVAAGLPPPQQQQQQQQQQQHYVLQLGQQAPQLQGLPPGAGPVGQQQQPFQGPSAQPAPGLLPPPGQQQYQPVPGPQQQQAPPPYQQQGLSLQEQYMGGPPRPGGMAPPPQQPAPQEQAPLFGGPLGALPPGVQMHLSRIMNSSGGLVHADHFDPKIVDMMQRMGEGPALRALDEFASNDYRSIRNVTGYLIGIFKKYQAEATAGGGGPRGGGRFAGPGPDRSHGPRGRGGRFGERGGYERPPLRRDGAGRSRWEDSGPRGGTSGSGGGGSGGRASPRYDWNSPGTNLY